MPLHFWFLLFLLIFERERERERTRAGGGVEGEEADSLLSREPDPESSHRTLGSRPELKADVQPAEPRRCPYSSDF